MNIKDIKDLFLNKQDKEVKELIEVMKELIMAVLKFGKLEDSQRLALLSSLVMAEKDGEKGVTLNGFIEIFEDLAKNLREDEKKIKEIFGDGLMETIVNMSTKEKEEVAKQLSKKFNI